MRKFILLFPLVINGCISTQQTEHAHEVLNVVTEVAQPMYELLVGYCHARQLEIVQQDITTTMKRAKIAKVRTFCGKASEHFESAITAQRAARFALDNGDTLAALAKIDEAREHIVNGEQEFARFKEKQQ